MSRRRYATGGSSGNKIPGRKEVTNSIIPIEPEEDECLESIWEGMTRDENPQERRYPNASDASATGARAEGNNYVSDGRAPDTLPYGIGENGTTNTGVISPTSMDLQVNGDPSGHLFIRLGLTMEAA